MTALAEKKESAARSNTGVKPAYKQTEEGVIPEEWEVKRLGEIAHIKTGSHLN